MSAAKAIDAIPNKNSDAMTWQAWYEILPFSQKDNNVLFAKAFALRGDVKANTSDLRFFLQGKGLTLPANSVFGTMKDYELSFLDGVGTFLKIGAYGSMAVTAGTIIFAGVIIYRILTPEGAGIVIGTAAKAYTGKP